MIAGGVTKTFGVIAGDSAVYDPIKGQVILEAPACVHLVRRTGCAFAFTGSLLYFEGFGAERGRWTLPFEKLVTALSDQFMARKAAVVESLANTVTDAKEREGNFCALVLGMYKGHPTIAQLNSFLDFSPKYLWTEDEPKFSTIAAGEESNVYQEASEYMGLRSAKTKELMPGAMIEVLTRGIYRKADIDEKNGSPRRTGGAVNGIAVTPSGSYPLSGFQFIGE